METERGRLICLLSGLMFGSGEGEASSLVTGLDILSTVGGPGRRGGMVLLGYEVQVGSNGRDWGKILIQ